MKYWRRTKSSSHDVQKTFLPYLVVVASNIILLLSLLVQNSSIWFYLTGLTLCMGQGTVSTTEHSLIKETYLRYWPKVYMFETIGVPVNFPLASQGIIFAVIELAGALINLGYGLSTIKVKWEVQKYNVVQPWQFRSSSGRETEFSSNPHYRQCVSQGVSALY